MFAGHATDGGCVSLTVTVNEQLDPTAVEQLTVVVPLAKNVPDAGLQFTAPHTISAAGNGKVTTAPHWPGSADLTMFAGQLMMHGNCDGSMIAV